MAEMGEKAKKNIVICCDGTGNEFGDCNSNVVKLYTMLTINNEQVGYYHPGVGTMGAPMARGAIGKWWSKVKGLAFGQGFMANVEDAYRYLMQEYNDGDRVYLFGFSRGAYTARALAAILHAYGLLCKGNEGQFPYLWKSFNEDMEEARRTKKPSLEIPAGFKETFSRAVNLHFVGLWDTVSSVGWVTEPVKLLYSAQNPIIQTGRHAVSIDERRCFFRDNLWGPALAKDDPAWQKMLHGLWDGYDPSDPTKPKVPADDPRWQREQSIFQVWFAGVHSDVGGSYEQRESALANVSLKWLLGEALKAGLMVEDDRVEMIFGRPTKKEHAAAVYYETPRPGWETQKIHRSLHGPWWVLEVLPHQYYKLDNSGDEETKIPLGRSREIPDGSVVHGSVVARMRHRESVYRPRNLEMEKLAPHSPERLPGTEFAEFYRYEKGHVESAGGGVDLAKGLAAVAAVGIGLGLLAKRFR